MASLNAFRAQSFPLLGKKRARMRFKYFAGMTNMHSSAMQGFLVSQGAKSKNEKNVAIYVFFWVRLKAWVLYKCKTSDKFHMWDKYALSAMPGFIFSFPTVQSPTWFEGNSRFKAFTFLLFLL